MKNNLLFLTIGLLIFEVSFSQPFNITSTLSYNDEFASGTYQIYRNSYDYSLELSELNKPMILVEGFDPTNSNTINPTSQYFDIYKSFNKYPSYFLNDLHDEEIDIIVLNFTDGGDYIQKNAMLLVELIQQVNASKPNDEPLVVMGYSMGGLVARYALAYMEEHNMNHETKLYVSLDSPHKGAHVPLSIQALVSTFENTIFATNQDFQNLLKMRDAPAAKQMLKYRLDDATTPSGEMEISQDHLNFLEEMETLNDCHGFPTQCRNIAVSYGSWNSVGQRSNLDYDDDGVADLQYSGFPVAFVNNPTSEDEEIEWLWELNNCELISIVFQAMMSTSASTNYPHYIDRNDYAGGFLDGFNYATYNYNNFNSTPLSLFMPIGSWSRLWYYFNEEPMDFAPGGYSNSYKLVKDNLQFSNTMQCHYTTANNHTFIPTTSALAFDTDDLFYNIYEDDYKLDKTPFDNIIGITGDNTSHINNSSMGGNAIELWLVDEITGNYGFSCSKEFEEISGDVSSGQNILVHQKNYIKAADYTINSGASVSLIAEDEIRLMPGFHAKEGSNFSASIESCYSKSCFWKQTTIDDNNFSTARLWSSNDFGVDTLINTKAKEIKVYPNPTRNNFKIELLEYDFSEKVSYRLVDVKGISFLNNTINLPIEKVDISRLPNGVYFLSIIRNGSISNWQIVKTG